MAAEGPMSLAEPPVHTHMYIYIYVYTCIHIYMYIGRNHAGGGAHESGRAA